MSPSDIQSAIRTEMAETPKFQEFKIIGLSKEPNGNSFRVEVAPLQMPTKSGKRVRAVLDNSLIGKKASWPTDKDKDIDQPEGTACVEAVSTDQITLTDATGCLPEAFQRIQIESHNYLRALSECWADHEWGKLALACIEDLDSPSKISSVMLSAQAFPWLRHAQRQALELVNFSSSFLWGPPGTGKTTTLGAILAEYLETQPQARVLLVSTTNYSVDQATIAVDKALEKTNRSATRKSVKRVGNEYLDPSYIGREHLLAQSNDIPPDTRMISMTINRAILAMDVLRELEPFDLLVLDEASQVGLAHALVLMPLAKARMFAGDPMQLPPVIRSSSEGVKRWMGRSPFACKPDSGPAVCLLNEQSRMIGPISDLVSELFYDSQLKVAPDALSDADWLKARKQRFGWIPPNVNVHIEWIETDCDSSGKSKANSREESATRIMGLLIANANAKNSSSDNVLVLTPFRAQASLLRKMLSELPYNSIQIKVGTIHSSQGSEASVVIFDPVNGIHRFLENESSRQLINVALSRAQSKLIFMLSPSDLKLPLFSKIVDIVDRHASRYIVSINEVLACANYRTSAIGKRIRIGHEVAEITEFMRNGKSVFAVMEHTGERKCFDVAALLMSSDYTALHPFLTVDLL